MARPSILLGFALGLLVVFASAAGAATSITTPTGNPYVVQLDAQGKPVPFTVVAKGFTPGAQVYVEQCDARTPAAPHWLPTRDCDLGSSPAAALADSSGTARFPAGDLNHGFPAFTGLGPEGLFSCLTPTAPSLHNDLPEYRSCQIRVSTNNSAATTDQVFLPIAFGAAPTGSGSGSGSSKSSSSNATTIVVAVIAVGVIAIAVGVVLRRRRSVSAR